MTTYARKNRRIVAPSRPARAIRWLGAYGRASDLESMLHSETVERIEVACEIIPHGDKSGLTRPGVGLLVDQQYTTLVRCYAEDSWTRDNGHGYLSAEHDVPYVTRWNECSGLRKRGAYMEGTIRDPIYSAVVIRPWIGNSLAVGQEIAKRLGLPVVLEEQPKEKKIKKGKKLPADAKVGGVYVVDIMDDDGRLPGQWKVRVLSLKGNVHKKGEGMAWNVNNPKQFHRVWLNGMYQADIYVVGTGNQW